MMNRPPRPYALYLDMDGCLTDFDKAAKNLTTNFDTMNDSWQHGLTDSHEYKTWHDDLLLKIKSTDNFWLNLEWMKDGKRYFEHIKQTYQHDCIAILTAPMRDDRCSKDKLLWCMRELEIIPKSRFICVDVKHDYINHINSDKQILIDDRIHNINQWVAAGGIGVLHTSTDDTIAELKDIIGY